MVAASERPAQSNEPLPSLEGDDLPGLNSPGAESQPRPREAARAAISPAQAQQHNKARAKIPAKAGEAAARNEKAERDESHAHAAPDPASRGFRTRVARSRPPAPPAAAGEAEAGNSKTAAPPQPSRPQTPGFQPERRVTRLTGGITNRGRASVDAIGTPLGRYKKAISDAIGSRWYYYVTTRWTW